MSTHSITTHAARPARPRPTHTHLPPLPLQIGSYWGWFGARTYHHTAPISTFYAMREALALVAEEGLGTHDVKYIFVPQEQ